MQLVLGFQETNDYLHKFTCYEQMEKINVNSKVN